MAKKIAVGIDIGTYQIKTVVAEATEEGGGLLPRILGTGFAESRGLRHGYIINPTDVLACLKRSVVQAEKSSGVRIRKAFVSVGGVGLGSVVSSGSVIITRADAEIGKLDMDKVVEAAGKEIPPSIALNRQVIHSVPIQYKLDGKVVLGNPVGMRGAKLEAKVLFVNCLERHIEDLVDAVEAAGIEVVDVMAAPFAAGLVTLSKTQKIAGCLLANIGAETLSIAAFENNRPISLEVFPRGSTDITNDIAIGFKIPIEEAEHLKLGGLSVGNYPKKKLDEIIEARLSDMFELIEAHLKKIGRAGLLPAGIIITGGGGGVDFVEELAKRSLALPSKVATILVADNKSPFKDPSWSVACGLCVFGLEAEHSGSIDLGIPIGKIRDRIVNLFKQFLP
ncbi:MAG: cell division protein FtsA [Patescibacteria group bacterium]